MFITFEGGEGSGKSTIIQAVASTLAQRATSYLVTREPGGTRMGELIRQLILNVDHGEITPRTEALLYAASRAQHLETVILPALQNHQIVLCDRYLDSSLAYQAYARGLGNKYLLKINDYALSTIPDLTFYLDVAPQVGLERITHREKKDRLDLEPLAFHALVHQGYLRLAKRDPQRIKIINGHQTLDQMIAQVLSILTPYLDA